MCDPSCPPQSNLWNVSVSVYWIWIKSFNLFVTETKWNLFLLLLLENRSGLPQSRSTSVQVYIHLHPGPGPDNYLVLNQRTWSIRDQSVIIKYPSKRDPDQIQIQRQWDQVLMILLNFYFDESNEISLKFSSLFEPFNDPSCVWLTEEWFWFICVISRLSDRCSLSLSPCVVGVSHSQVQTRSVSLVLVSLKINFNVNRLHSSSLNQKHFLFCQNSRRRNSCSLQHSGKHSQTSHCTWSWSWCWSWSYSWCWPWSWIYIINA